MTAVSFPGILFSKTCKNETCTSKIPKMDQHLKTLLLIYFALAPALLTSQDYFYYRNKAELAFINGAEKEALKFYEKLYQLKRHEMFATDAFNGLIICGKNKGKARKFLDVLAMQGVSFDHLKKNIPGLDSYISLTEYEIKVERGVEFRSKSKVRKVLKELYDLDQSTPSGRERNAVFLAFKDAFFSFLAEDQVNPMSLGVVIAKDSFGFNDDWVTLPLFHYSVVNDFSEKEMEYLLSAIKKGNIKPEAVLWLENERINGISNFDCFPAFYKIDQYWLELDQQKNNRISPLYEIIGAHSLKDLKNILLFYYCSGRKIKLNFTWGIRILITNNKEEALNLFKAFEQSPYVACKNSLCNCFPTN